MSNLYTYYTQVIFFSFIVINHLFEVYLTRRQLKTYQNDSQFPPVEFTSYLTVAEHRKALAYSTAKLKTSQFHLLYDAALLIYWFPMRGAEKLYLALPLQGIHREVAFIVAFSLIQFMLSLPWQIFSTFYTEQKFGHNKSTPSLFFMDRLKGLALGAVIGLPLLYALIFLFNAFGDLWWVASFILVVAFQLLLLWAYPTLIAPLFNKFRPLEEEELKNDIQKLVKNAGLNAKEVFIMDASKRSTHGNAYFTGLGKNKRVVFFDTLLTQLKNQETLAILAHELGHMKLKHIPKSLAQSLVLSFLGFYLMGKVAHQDWFYHGHFIGITSPGVLILLFTQALGHYTFWFTPIHSWISRKREYEADAYAAKETDPQDLINGLLKLYQQNSGPVVTDKIYSRFYHSHPPALERVKFLNSLKG